MGEIDQTRLWIKYVHYRTSGGLHYFSSCKYYDYDEPRHQLKMYLRYQLVSWFVAPDFETPLSCWSHKLIFPPRCPQASPPPFLDLRSHLTQSKGFRAASFWFQFDSMVSRFCTNLRTFSLPYQWPDHFGGVNVNGMLMLSAWQHDPFYLLHSADPSSDQ